MIKNSIKKTAFVFILLAGILGGVFFAAPKTYAQSTSAKDYDFELVSQSAYPSTLKPGETVQVSLTIKNTGINIWQNSGTNIVRLGTGSAYGAANQQRDYTSEFADESWLSKNRPINISRSQIVPGETSDFNFIIKAPEANGTYKAYFTPVVDGYKWMKDIGIYWQITVEGGVEKLTSANSIKSEDTIIQGFAPSVVKIMCRYSNRFVNQGSGTLFYNSGNNPNFPTYYILTNLHVVENENGTASSCEIRLYPDYQNPNYLVFTSYGYKTPVLGADFAILEPMIAYGYGNAGTIDDLTRYAQKTSFVAENNDTWDWSGTNTKVYVFGYPGNGNLSVSQGDFLYYELYESSRFIDTSNKLSSGYSGGLAVDSSGKILGIPTFVRGGSLSMILDINHLLGTAISTL